MVLTFFADAAVAATTFGCLKIATAACRLVGRVKYAAAIASTSVAAAVNGAIDRRQQFGTSRRRCRIEINADTRTPTD